MFIIVTKSLLKSVNPNLLELGLGLPCCSSMDGTIDILEFSCLSNECMICVNEVLSASWTDSLNFSYSFLTVADLP